MKKDLLLVVDMQNVYASGGTWCCPKTELAAHNIRKLLDSQKAEHSMDVIFTQFIASENPKGAWVDYNVECEAVNADTYANEMMDIFAEDLKKYPLYTKSVYSSLAIPQVAEAVENAHRVVLTGVVAECCIISTAMALMDAGAHIIYLTDACAGLSQASEDAVEMILAGLEPLHVMRMTTEEYLRKEK